MFHTGARHEIDPHHPARAHPAQSSEGSRHQARAQTERRRSQSSRASPASGRPALKFCGGPFMATRFVLTMVTSNTDGETMRAETVQICEMLYRAAQLLGSTHATSATIKDRNGNPTLTYTYTPTAPH